MTSVAPGRTRAGSRYAIPCQSKWTACSEGTWVPQISWCKLEVTVDDPKTVNPFADNDEEAPKEVPPLTITSVSVREIVNHKENKREIVAITLRTWKDSASPYSSKELGAS